MAVCPSVYGADDDGVRRPTVETECLGGVGWFSGDQGKWIFSFCFIAAELEIAACAVVVDGLLIWQGVRAKYQLRSRELLLGDEVVPAFGFDFLFR